MCKLTALKEPHILNPEIGCDLQTFRSCVKELAFENDDMCKRFFEIANTRLTGLLDWKEFLESMKVLMTKNLEMKVERFFQIID